MSVEKPNFSVPEEQPEKKVERQLSPEEKEKLLVEAEANLAALQANIEELESMEERGEEKAALLEELKEQAEGLAEFIRLGREPDSSGTSEIQN